MDVRQQVLNEFQDKIISSIPGWGWIEKLLNMRGIDIVAYSKKIDEMILPFMYDDGSINGELMKEMLGQTNPKIAAFIPNSKFNIMDKLEDAKAAIKQIKGLLK